MKLSFLAFIMLASTFSCQHKSEIKVHQVLKEINSIQKPRFKIETIMDLIHLKKKGIGFSTFGTSNQKFELENELKYFGAYNLFDTTGAKRPEYLGVLEVTTNVEIAKHEYASNDEMVIAFSTENQIFDFGEQLIIGQKLNFKLHNELVKTDQGAYQFEKNKLDFIVLVNESNIILSITIGKFISRK